MKIVTLLFACLVSPDYISAMRQGLQLPHRPSVARGSADNYDLPLGTAIYIRITAEILLFGSLRMLQGFPTEIGYSPYGNAFVYGDAMRTIGDRQEWVKYGADLHVWDDRDRSEYEIRYIIGCQDSHLVYIERSGMAPLRSTLFHQSSLSGTRSVTFIGPTRTRIARGALQQVAENEPVWRPFQGRIQPGRRQPSTSQEPSAIQQLPAPGGSRTAEMNFQPNIHILLRGSEPGFRFENGRFCRGQDEKTDPQEGDIVTQSGAPIGRFRDLEKKWYPLNLRPRK